MTGNRTSTTNPDKRVRNNDFIHFMLDCGVLRFGSFTTKSGRQTPYFINTGLYDSGSKISRLGSFYAQCIQKNLFNKYDVLYGPAYKGIPLVVTASCALSNEFQRDVPFAFNRKESKDHGEKGNIVGHQLRDGDRVLIVEDVTTAGTSVHESVQLLRSQADIQLAGLVVSVDRQEKGTSERNALAELSEQYEMPVFAIVSIDEIIDHLSSVPINGKLMLEGEILQKVRQYRAEYGATS